MKCAEEIMDCKSNASAATMPSLGLRRRTSSSTSGVLVLACSILAILALMNEWNNMSASRVRSASSSATAKDVAASGSDNRSIATTSYTWDWSPFRQLAANASTTKSPNNLLISQYGDGSRGSYADLLNLTSRVNRAYARLYSVDYVVLSGNAFLETPKVLDRRYHSYRGQRQQQEQKPPLSRATYNKIPLMEKALELGYEFLLILDSDAMMFDFDRDISLEIPSDKMIMAHKVLKYGRDCNVNIGVVLWNLNHPLTARTLRLWKRRSLSRIMLGLRDDDQLPLQRVLSMLLRERWRHNNRGNPIHAVQQEFQYGDGTMIKHFLRPSSKSWTDASIHDARVAAIQSAADQVCSRYAPVCDGF